MTTEAAEQACGDIRLLQAEHGRASHHRTHLQPGRIPGFEPTVVERATQLALTTIVAVAEHFSAGRLRELPGVRESDTASWPKQETAWAARANVTLTNLPAYQPFRGFNEVRNAVMHGRGSLTPLQLIPARVGDVRLRLAAAGVRVLRDRLVVDQEDLDRCADVCAEFVQQLDGVAP